MSRPDCECHSEPMTRKGERWTCSVRNREASARNRAKPGTVAFEESHEPHAGGGYFTVAAGAHKSEYGPGEGEPNPCPELYDPGVFGKLPIWLMTPRELAHFRWYRRYSRAQTRNWQAALAGRMEHKRALIAELEKVLAHNLAIIRAAGS